MSEVVPKRDLALRVDPRADLPIYAQLRQQLTWRLVRGDLRPGDRLPTIRDLAGQLGVHMHTVRQAYHSLEDDGLLETRPSRGTRVKAFELDKLVTAESATPSHTIGVLIPNIHSFYDPLISGLEEVARKSGYMIIVCITRDDADLTRQSTRQLVAKRVDGIIAASPVAGEIRRQLSRSVQGPPLVFVDSPQVRTNAVLFDLENAGFVVARHFIEHGHTRIAFVTASLAWPNFRDTFNGFVRGLAVSSLEPDHELVVETPSFSLEEGYRAGLRLLELQTPPKAVFVSGDLMAGGVVRALEDNGLLVPQDVAIISKDDIELAALMDPQLTTVKLPAYRMGVEAMNMLVALMAGQGSRKKRVVLASELVVRASCGCPLPGSRTAPTSERAASGSNPPLSP